MGPLLVQVINHFLCLAFSFPIQIPIYELSTPKRLLIDAPQVLPDDAPLNMPLFQFRICLPTLPTNILVEQASQNRSPASDSRKPEEACETAMKRLKDDVAALEIHPAETKIECRILQVGLVDSELLAETIQLRHFSQCLSEVWGA